MVDLVIAFVIGLVIGAFCGLVTTCLMVMSKGERNE